MNSVLRTLKAEASTSTGLSTAFSRDPSGFKQLSFGTTTRYGLTPVRVLMAGLHCRDDQCVAAKHKGQ